MASGRGGGSKVLDIPVLLMMNVPVLGNALRQILCLLLAAAPCCALGASLGNFVWNDLDGDGRQDEGEPGLAGVTVQLWNPAKTLLIDSAVTDSAGNYIVTSPAAGDYRIRAFLRYPQDIFSPKDMAGGSDLLDSDVNPTGADAGFTDIFTVSAELISRTSLDVGIIQDPMTDHTLGDRVFKADGAGLQGGGTISGVMVELLGSSGAVLQTTSSDAGGYYSFKAPPGIYRLRFTAPSFYIPSPHPNSGSDNSVDSDIDANGLTATFTLAAGMVRRDLDAGFVTPVSVGNFVWSDENADGQQNAGEPGIPGVTVELWDGDKTRVLDKTLTDNAGNYLLHAPGPGDYRVFVLRPLASDIFTKRAIGSATSDSNIYSTSADYGFSELLTFAPGLISIASIDAGIVLDTGPRKIPAFRVVSLVPGPDSSVLTFAGPVGGTYQIDRSPDLTSWEPVGSPIVSTSTTTSRPVAVPMGSQKQYFRVNRTR
jgi:hypothetical protein